MPPASSTTVGNLDLGQDLGSKLRRGTRRADFLHKVRCTGSSMNRCLDSDQDRKFLVPRIRRRSHGFAKLRRLAESSCGRPLFGSVNIGNDLGQTSLQCRQMRPSGFGQSQPPRKRVELRLKSQISRVGGISLSADPDAALPHCGRQSIGNRICKGLRTISVGSDYGGSAE